MRRSVFLLFCLAVFWPRLAAAAPQNSDQRPYSTVVRANNEFALKYVKEAFNEAPRKNVLTSPAALSYAFALLLNGASKPARDEIAQAFELKDSPVVDVNAANAELKKIRTSTYVTSARYKKLNYFERAPIDADHWTHKAYTVSGAFWTTRGAFSPQFLTINRSSYGFTSKNQRPSAAAIQAWAIGANRGKAVQFVDASGTERDFAITVLTRFNSKWRHEFNESETRPAEFHLPAGATKPAQFMQQNAEFLYYETDHLQAIKLDFSDGWMIVVLPSEQSSLEEFMEGLNRERWEELNKNFGKRPGHLELPRFEIAQRDSVVPVLQQMGVRRVFSDMASLAGC